MQPGKARTPISDVVSLLNTNIERFLVEWLPGGVISNSEYIVRNPTRKDKTAGSFSINMKKGSWADFASGDSGGDLVSLYAYINGKNNGQAADELAERYMNGKTPVLPPPPFKPAKKDEPDIISPIPDDAPPIPKKFDDISFQDDSGEWIKRKVDHRYVYRDAKGRVLGYVDRADKNAEYPHKETRPLSLTRKNGKYEWARKALPKPRPLYGLDKLAANPDARVLVVEGEKCADAGNMALGSKNWVVVCAPGGSNVAASTDFKPLRGRDVVLWPDNDRQLDKNGNVLPRTEQPSYRLMSAIVQDIQAGRIMQIPEDYPDKWDIADALSLTSERQITDIESFIEDCLPRKLEPCVAAAANDNAPVESTPISDEPIFPDIGSNGPKLTELNVEALLNKFNIKMRYNLISKEIDCDVPGKSFSNDNYANAVNVYIRSLAAVHGLPQTNIDAFIDAVAFKNEWNPVSDWISSAPWDGNVRVGELVDTIQAADGYPESLKSTLIVRWLISAVAAAYDDDFRNRGVLVLQGAQGIGKTTWLRTITHNKAWFGEGQVLDPADKDNVTEAISKWIVELGELEGTMKYDMPRLKAFLTRTYDEIRRPFARKASKYSRRTVFAGTVNSMLFLADETGNDRFWCIPCAKITQPKDIDMQQLWAEVKYYYENGEQWWLTADENKLLIAQNKDFESSEPIDEMIDSTFDWTAAQSSWTYRTTTQLLIECGIREPKKSQTTKAGIYIKSRTGQAPKVLSGNVRTYLFPPKKETARMFWLPQNQYEPRGDMAEEAEYERHLRELRESEQSSYIKTKH